MRSLRPSEISWALAAVAAVLASIAVYEHSVIADLRGQRDQLLAQRNQISAERQELADEQNPKIIAAKKDCAASAQRFFRKLGYNEDLTNNKAGLPHTESFSSHYSRRLGRCLMATDVEDYASDRSGAHETITKGIWDPDEQRAFGDYFWISSNTKKYWEQRPMMCRMEAADKPEAYCTTTAEWDDYQRDLMNS